MLQQTTVGTVLNHFEKFLKKFPTIESLAAASEDELAVEWKGLGYYRRARNLKNGAEEICQKYAGVVPVDRESLIGLKGIGDYTADALIAIGANKKAIAVDANIERVVARLYCLEEEKGVKLQKKIRVLFHSKKIFPEINNEFRALNEALMDLGRVYCQSRKAYCEQCPVNNSCQSYAQKVSLEYPKLSAKETQKKKNAGLSTLSLLRIVVFKKNKVLVYKKPKGSWLENQWEVPTYIYDSSDKELKQYPWYHQCLTAKERKDIEKKISKTFFQGIFYATYNNY